MIAAQRSVERRPLRAEDVVTPGGEHKENGGDQTHIKSPVEVHP